MNKKLNTSAILLAGGLGTRLNASIPKQYLILNEKAIALYSFDLLLKTPEINEIVVVCFPNFNELFISSEKLIKFALPGKRRQDSVFNGFQKTSHPIICIHDSARPFVTKEDLLQVLEAGKCYGAATLGVPLKFTVKETTPQNFVKSTLDRTKIWEIQTPQVLHRDILEEGFKYAQEHAITVTDDVSLGELIGKPAKLIEGSYTNIKITVSEDLIMAKHLINSIKNNDDKLS